MVSVVVSQISEFAPPFHRTKDKTLTSAGSFALKGVKNEELETRPFCLPPPGCQAEIIIPTPHPQV
jgi:hypothetical protein